MEKFSKYVGLDVHKDTIAVAIAAEDSEVRFYGEIANNPTESPRILRRLQTLRRWSHEQEIKSFFTRGA